jgi:diguanylate cyclase (GGDEF)-like protein
MPDPTAPKEPENTARAPHEASDRAELTSLRASHAALARDYASLLLRSSRLVTGLSLLSRIAGLARSGDDLRATACAVLTGVTAGVGLGLNRGVVLVPTGRAPDEGALELEVLAAVGPIDHAEADRVWRAIERDAPDLETLYEAGLRALAEPSALDRALRGRRVTLAPRGDLASLALGAIDALDPSTRLVAPLGGDVARFGLLAADNRYTGRAPDDETALLFSLVASLAGPALASAARFEQVAREAMTDPLTGLASRRTGDALLRETCASALLAARPVALVLLDLDDFKRINDGLGHPVGDAVLREVGARLRARLPARTRAFRYGGEELAVVCDGLDADGARELAEELRLAVSALPIATPRGPLSVTTSAGVASGLGTSAELLVDRADAALLRAKRAGKNRVEIDAP